MSFRVIKNDVYPFSLVVATSVSDLKEINKKYESIDREELKARKCSEATTYPVFKRKNQQKCSLYSLQFQTYNQTYHT